MGVRSSVGRRLSAWKWWEQGAGDTTKLDNWPLTLLHTLSPDAYRLIDLPETKQLTRVYTLQIPVIKASD